MVVWFISDQSLLFSNLYLNNELIETHIWFPYLSGNVTVNLGPLPIGAHNYTLQVVDAAMLVVNDTVFVEVLLETTTATPTDTTTTSNTTTTDTGTGIITGGEFDFLGSMTLVISVGSAIVILVVVILVSKRR